MLPIISESGCFYAVLCSVCSVFTNIELLVFRKRKRLLWSWNFDLIPSLLPSTFKNKKTDFDGHTAADNLFTDLSAQYLYVKSWISHTASSIFSHRVNSMLTVCIQHHVSVSCRSEIRCRSSECTTVSRRTLLSILKYSSNSSIRLKRVTLSCRSGRCE